MFTSDAARDATIGQITNLLKNRQINADEVLQHARQKNKNDKPKFNPPAHELYPNGRDQGKQKPKSQPKKKTQPIPIDDDIPFIPNTPPRRNDGGPSKSPKNNTTAKQPQRSSTEQSIEFRRGAFYKIGQTVWWQRNNKLGVGWQQGTIRDVRVSPTGKTKVFIEKSDGTEIIAVDPEVKKLYLKKPSIWNRVVDKVLGDSIIKTTDNIINEAVSSLTKKDPS